MFSSIIITVSLASMVAGNIVSPNQNTHSLASRDFSLENRYDNDFVNGVFKDNILLTLAYLRGLSKVGQEVDWSKVKEPFTYSFELAPGEAFAYHDAILSEYQDKVKVTTNAHFGANEGFKSDGYLMGDGVCHLASLIYWAASDAGLDVLSRVNHDFAKIPEVPGEFGVSIYATGQNDSNSQNQNLYILNNRDNEIEFKFVYDGKRLKVEILEAEIRS